MKAIMVLVAFLLLVSVPLLAQDAPIYKANVFTPRTLSAGTLMSGRTESSTYDDTTQAFTLRGWGHAYVGVVTSTNDSARVLISYRVSNDGYTYGAFVSLDSLSTSGTVGAQKFFALPSDAMGAYSCEVRVYSNTDVLKYSASPSTKLTTVIVRKQN